MNIQELEARVAQLAQQLEQSLSNHNFLAGMKTEAERVLSVAKQNAEADVVPAVEKTAEDTIKQLVESQTEGNPS